VGSFEKSAGLIDRLLKYGDKDLVMKVFRLGSKASHYSWQMAVCLLENSPGIIEKIGPEALEAIADFGAKIARHSWLPAVDMIEKSPTLIDRILAYGDKCLVKDVYCICSRIGDQCWRTALHLLEKSPDILVRAGSTGFEKIAERASELSGVKYERAISFINGESFESALFIDEFSYGIELKKVKPILSNYLNALLSYRVELAESKDHYTDGKKIFLPEIINDFEEKQKNFTAYKVFATHEEAHIEYGSFDFSLSKIEDVVLRIRERYGGKWDNNE
jgi:hypothetical protein